MVTTAARDDDSPEGIGRAYTEQICNSPGPACSERLRVLFADLTRHLHDFVRDNNMTNDEFKTMLNLLNEAGQMSNERRNETQFFFAFLGIETLLDRMQDAQPESGSTEIKTVPTASNLIGPFYQNDSPLLDAGSTIVLDGSHDDSRVYMHGRVLDSDTLQPVSGAELDIWHSNAAGIYAQQDPSQPKMNLRGRFKTDTSGHYHLYCGRPSFYPIPNDGPAGRVLKMLDRHPFRPAHIHAIVRAQGYAPVTTELFDSACKHVSDDCMYAVKDSLKVEFVPLHDSDKADYEVTFDFYLRRQQIAF